VPGPADRVEVVAGGIDAKTLRIEAPVTVDGEGDDRDGRDESAHRKDDVFDVLSHAEGETIHEASVKLQLEGPYGSETREVALPGIENRIQLGADDLILYRAPEGLVFLRVTQDGHYSFLREIDQQEMILVPGGISRRGMGEKPPNGPSHIVKLGPFLVDRTEVTCRAYARFLKRVRREDVSHLRHVEDPGVNLRPRGWKTDEPPADLLDKPVTGVDWYCAYAYARWVGGRLPTEAEWERAAAGPLGLAFPWGDEFDVDRCCWRAKVPLPAESLVRGEGPFALLHAAGNVREWNDDRYDPRWYLRRQRVNPRGPSRPKHRVVRGGSFSTPVAALRLQNRDQEDPLERAPDLGFRVALRWHVNR